MDSDWRALRESPAAQSFAARKCARHLSRIPQMDFYDRLREMAEDRLRP